MPVAWGDRPPAPPGVRGPPGWPSLSYRSAQTALSSMHAQPGLVQAMPKERKPKQCAIAPIPAQSRGPDSATLRSPRRRPRFEGRRRHPRGRGSTTGVLDKDLQTTCGATDRAPRGYRGTGVGYTIRRQFIEPCLAFSAPCASFADRRRIALGCWKERGPWERGKPSPRLASSVMEHVRTPICPAQRHRTRLHAPERTRASTIWRNTSSRRTRCCSAPSAASGS